MKVMKRFLAMLLCVAMVATLFAGLTLTASAASYTDELTRSWTGVSNTSYKSWSDKTGSASGVVYAGNSAGPTSGTGSDSIQLRSTSSSGIWTTANTNGYYVKSVSVTWHSSTSTGRTLQIYGKATAFSSYSTSGATLLGTIVNGTSTSYTLTSEQQQTYQYILLKSSSGAMYLTQIDVEWESINGTTHTVSSAVNPSGAGTVTLGATTVAEGSTTTATATPGADYTFTGWTISGTGASLSSTTDNPTTVTVGTEDVTVTANFAAKQQYTLTYSVNGDTTVIASEQQYEGNEVTLPTASAIGEHTFVGWLPSTYAESDTAPSGLLDAGSTYTMPSAATTLYAVYAIEESSGASGEYTLVESAPSNWSGDYVIANTATAEYVMIADGSISGNTYSTSSAVKTIADAGITYDSTNKKLTGVSDSYVFTVSAASTGKYYIKLKGANTDMYLIANSSTGSSSVSTQTTTSTSAEWTFEGIGSSGNAYLIGNSSRYLGWNASYFRTYAESNKDTYKAFLFKASGASYSGYTTTIDTSTVYYTLNYSAAPAEGGTVTCDTATGAQVAEDTDVTLTATAATHYTFDSWTVTGTSDYAADGAEVVVTMTDDVVVTANFTADPTYTVTVTQVSGGTLTASATSGIFAGDTVTLTATADEHYTFGGWTVTGATLADSTATYVSFTMPAADVTVTGTFNAVPQYTVTYYSYDTTVLATQTYYEGDTIAAADVPSVTAPDDYAFKGWYGATYDAASEPTYVTPAGTTVSGDLAFHAVYAEYSDGVSDTFKMSVTSGSTTHYVGVQNSTYLIDTTDASEAAEFGVEDGGYLYYTDGTTKTYVSGSTTTSLSFTTDKASATAWTVSDADGVISFTHASSGRVLAYNTGSSRFACYSTSGNSYPYSFTKTECATIDGYTTNPVPTKSVITWMNGSDVYQTDKVLYGNAITAPATDPEKTEAEQEYYTFAGWSELDGGTVVASFPNASAELGDKTYYAVYTTTQKLTVTWNNYDDTTLATQYYKAGETPVYSGETPTKPSDSSFYYTFSGWTPTVSAVTAAITYTATFTANERYALTASVSRDSVKVGRYAQVNYTLTDAGTAVTTLTPTYTSANSAIASVDSTGKISGVAVGTTTITVSFADALDSNGDPVTATVSVTVIENTSIGGYTLITEDQTDWSGDYIFAGRRSGNMDDLNNLMIMTPGYDVTISSTHYDAVLEDGGSNGGVGLAQNNASWLDLTIDGTEATGKILSAYGEDDDIVMSSTGENDAGDYMVLDYIDSIDDSYAFTIELVDDVNGYYTIRIKGTDYYLANELETTSGNNALGYTFSVGDSNAPLWKISMYSNPVETDGYTPPIVSIQSVYYDSRSIYFNPHDWLSSVTECPGDNSNELSRFRTYGTDAATASKIGGTSYGGGANYSLYLYGNPNPFKAQIYYKGDQITVTNSGSVNADALTAQLTSALTPDILGYPSWSQVGDPTWSIVENSTGNAMTIDSSTGLVTLNGSTAGSYAMVQVSYTVHDNINNADHIISTIAKVDVITAATTYSTMIYELYSGTDTEVQYTIPSSVTSLPLAAYVVNDTTNDNSKTGSVVMGGTLSWSIDTANSILNGTFTVDSNGVLSSSNVTEDSVVTVTVSGATGDGVSATAATFKVYVKPAAYTLTIVPTADSQGTYTSADDTLTISGSETSGKLTYNVVDDDNQGPSASTFTLAGGAWTISGTTYGALINSNGVLDLSGVDRSEDHTITVVVSRVSATDVATSVVKSGLTDTITVVIKAQTVEELMDAVDDTVIIDWALPVTFNVLSNDNYNVDITFSNGTLPTGVVSNGEGSFTYTPSGWQTTDQTFTYTLSGSVDGEDTTDTATVTLKTADSVYYEETYADIFTYTGTWTSVADGDAVDQQTSSLDTADCFEYDANHASYSMYSGGTAKMTTLSKGVSAGVSFTFVGTGFDIISATNNNTGAILMTVKDSNGAAVVDPNTGKKLNAIVDTFRGYTYDEDGFTRYGLLQVTRYDKNGDAYIPSDTGAYYYDGETETFIENDTWYTNEITRYSLDGETYVEDENGSYYYDAENDTYVENTKWVGSDYYETSDAFDMYLDDNGSYILKQYSSNWKPYSSGEEASYNGSFYQIPIMKVTGLAYGTYTVTIRPTYSAAYDRQGDGSYTFYFDGVRIHNPVSGRAAEYKYINISDAVDQGGFGSGTVVTCDHTGHDWTDWTFYSKATNTNSAVTCNRGSYVRYCSYCDGVADVAYFHVSVTADATELGVGGYNSLPASTTLHYTLTADEGDNQAAVQAKLDAVSTNLSEYWTSGSAAVMSCTNNSNVINANGAGTAYATLQLKDPTTQTVYASAIHSPDITVSEDEDHTHTFGDWTHVADSDPSSHSRTCTGESCSYTETEECVFTSEVTQEPSGSVAGITTYTCSVCGYSYTEEIPAEGFTATFHVPTGATAPEALSGTSVTMPAAVAAPADYDAHAYTFVGWVASTVNPTTTAQTVYTAGNSVSLSADTDFYALYTYGVAGSGTGWTKVTDLSTIEGGTVILVSGDGYAFNGTISSGNGQATSGYFTFDSDGNSETAPDGAVELTLTSTDNGFTMYNASYGYLYASAASAGSLAWHSTESSGWSYNSDNWMYASNSARLRVYNNTFRTYGNNSGTSLYMAVKGGVDKYYTTELASACHHTNTTSTTVAAGCTTTGSVTVTCDDCGEIISVTELAALGHLYEVTSVVDNVTTYTCSRCGDTYTEEGEYEVSYIMQTGVTYSGNSRDGNTITLPTAVSIPSNFNAQVYTLVGWATATAEDSSTAPAYSEPGATVTLTEDTIFYPVYSYGGASGYTLVSADEITAGTYAIGALRSTTASDNIYFATGATSSGDMVVTSDYVTSSTSGSTRTVESLPSGAAEFTFTGNNTDGFTIAVADSSNYLGITSTSSSRKLAFGDYSSTTWKAVDMSGSLLDGGVYLDCATATYKISENSTTTTAIRGYTGSTYRAIYLFKKAAGSGAGTTYTFTLQAAADNYSLAVTPATITMTVGSTATLSASLTNNGVAATAESLTFTSGNTSVVTVDSTGVMTAGSTTGTATITVEALAPDAEVYTATATVTVVEQSNNVTVNYIGSASGKVYNWGTRDTTATFLTALAADYYTGSYTYETLSALSGSSTATAAAIYSSALGTALHNMLVDKQTSTTSYDGTKTLYAYTDCVESDTAHLSAYYSATEVSSTWDSGTTWNREHTWPNSKGLNGSDENDIMMLRPETTSNNSSRGNSAYGESSGYYDPNKFGQNIHGDVARLMLQHLIRWGNTSYFYGSSGVIESRAILLEWLEEDPVDTWEMGRNDAVERITGVRNVFVDYPELAFILLGAEVPANYTTPSASGVVASATYSSSAGSSYTPVTTSSSKLTQKPATRTISTGTFNGAVIVDGKGTSNLADNQAAYGPEYGIYLAPGQGIVFSLSSDVTTITSQDLQIGAKALNGTATQLDVASISNGSVSTGIKYLLQNQVIASATEMYYELDTTQMGWTDGESSVLVIYNSGSGVLDVTNLRYSTANNNTLTMNISDAETKKASKMISIVYGEPETDPDPIVSQPSLNFKSASLLLASDIAMNFYVDTAVYTSAEDVYAVFTKALYDEKGNITGTEEVTVTEATLTDNGYCFRFEGINPAEMGSAVTATLYGTRDGAAISGKTVDYSVLTYVNNMFAKSGDADFLALLADLVNYGAAAQTYAGYNTANLVTANVSADLLAYATEAAPVLTSCTAFDEKADAAVKFTAAALTLRDKITVCYTVDASAYAGNIEDLSLRISYTDTNGAKKIAVISGSDFVSADGKYIASFSDLNALQMRTVLKAEIYEGSTCISSALYYSIESYACSKANGNDSLAALVNAMMKFGDSAVTYFAN